MIKCMFQNNKYCYADSKNIILCQFKNINECTKHIRREEDFVKTKKYIFIQKQPFRDFYLGDIIELISDEKKYYKIIHNNIRKQIHYTQFRVFFERLQENSEFYQTVNCSKILYDFGFLTRIQFERLRKRAIKRYILENINV